MYEVRKQVCPPGADGPGMQADELQGILIGNGAVMLQPPAPFCRGCTGETQEWTMYEEN
ncbi:MAG: hypothetical protein GX882_01850 [Methanomicrobiales archaeon]|nr:hypothetical protein [Methanomicrobiales archaeon]